MIKMKDAAFSLTCLFASWIHSNSIKVDLALI